MAQEKGWELGQQLEREQEEMGLGAHWDKLIVGMSEDAGSEAGGIVCVVERRIEREVTIGKDRMEAGTAVMIAGDISSEESSNYHLELMMLSWR
jgi:hypothetical protein